MLSLGVLKRLSRRDSGANGSKEPYIGLMIPLRSDSELIRAAQAGDGAAFAELIRGEYRIAFRLAYAILHDAGDAEDAVQEAAFKAWRKLGNLRSGSPIRPWLLAIVANHCRALGRRRWTLVEGAEAVDPANAEVDAAESLDLRRALGRLGHDERLVLLLRYYLDLPFDEIALIMRVTPKAARTRCERAVHRLRPALMVQEAII